ncbi:hypothetical protein LJR267_009350 [Paraburkholderia hospita]
MVRIDNRDVRLISRNGLNWTAKMPHLGDALATLPVDNAWLDSEAVMLDENGRPDFNALQNAFDRRSSRFSLRGRLFRPPYGRTSFRVQRVESSTNHCAAARQRVGWRLQSQQEMGNEQTGTGRCGRCSNGREQGDNGRSD